MGIFAPPIIFPICHILFNLLVIGAPTITTWATHKVVNVWVKGQIINFQTSIGDIPFKRFLR